MGRPERPLDDAGGPISEFAQDLRALRHLAGGPSYREMARTAWFAPSVLSSAAAGHRLPTLPVTLAFVVACGADRDAWEKRWRKVAANVGVEAEAPDEPVLARPASTTAANQQTPYLREVSIFVRPAQLPAGPSIFIGRRQALANACHLIRADGLVKAPLLISGPVGVGKTAFALRLSDDISAEFPDGQLYADLATGEPGRQSPDEVIGGFLRALEVPASCVPEEAAERGSLYRSLLAQRRLFVLIENPRDECQVRPLLGGAGHSQVVVTSRTRLLGLEGIHRIDLDTFARPESMALMGWLAGAHRVEAEYEAADTLAEVCEDLPLAVNIVGRKIAARPERAIAYTTRQLAARDRLMDSLSVGDVTVRDRLDSAYRQLPALGRQALHHLGRGGAGWATAAGLAGGLGVDVDAADGLLESLVDAGLLTRAEEVGRYYISNLVTVFAAHRDSGAPESPDGSPLGARAARRTLPTTPLQGLERALSPASPARR